MEDVMELSDFLFWLIGPGAGIAAYLIIKKLDIQVTFYGLMHRWTFKRMSPRQMRRVGIVLPGAIAALGYALAVVLGYTVAPTDAKAWAEALFQVATAAVTAQLIHGEKELLA